MRGAWGVAKGVTLNRVSLPEMTKSMAMTNGSHAAESTLPAQSKRTASTRWSRLVLARRRRRVRSTGTAAAQGRGGQGEG